MAPHLEPASPPADPASPIAGCLARFVWMLGGFAAVVITALTILFRPPWTLGARDAIFWIVVLAMVAARWVDVARYRGTTTDGRPATPRHVAIYAAIVLLASATLWLAAQSFQFP